MDTLDRHALNLEDLSNEWRAHFIARCVCGWTFEDTGIIGYNEGDVRVGMDTHYRMHVEGTTS